MGEGLEGEAEVRVGRRLRSVGRKEWVEDGGEGRLRASLPDPGGDLILRPGQGMCLVQPNLGLFCTSVKGTLKSLLTVMTLGSLSLALVAGDGTLGF